MKKMYKEAGCSKCNRGYVYHSGEQYTPYHSGSGFYSRCACSFNFTEEYTTFMNDDSITVREFKEIKDTFYDNNKIERYEN